MHDLGRVSKAFNGFEGWRAGRTWRTGKEIAHVLSELFGGQVAGHRLWKSFIFITDLSNSVAEFSFFFFFLFSFVGCLSFFFSIELQQDQLEI